MTSISVAHLTQAIEAFTAMSFAQREQLANELFAQQPNLLASVLVLDRTGAAPRHLETVLDALFVTWLATKAGRASWPLISEGMQESHLQRLAARMRFTEGLSTEQRDQMLQQYIDDHPEPHLLAFVYAHLRDSGVLSLSNEPHKHVVLAALNLVECIAHAAPRDQP